MNTRKCYRILSTLVCLTVMLALAIGNVKASRTLQGETDFAAIDEIGRASCRERV